MSVHDNFAQFFDRELLPHLQELEQRRVDTVNRVKSTGLTIGLIALVLAFGIGSFAQSRMGPPGLFFGLFGLMLGGIAYAIAYGSITKGYIAEFKDRIIGQIVRFIDPNLSYDKNDYIREPVYMASRIFLTDPDRYDGEDLVRGTVGKTAIEFSEVHSEYKTETRDKDGRTQTHWHTIFRGIFFIADFNKHFQGETIVLPDTAQRMFGRFGQMLQSWNLSRKGQLVKLEDPAFEERFVVYSDDQVEARYLLSTSLMARIGDFVAKTGKEVYLSFVASKLFVAISYQKNLFEPKLFQTVLDAALMQEYLEDLLLAVGIVEELNLNTRIWTKQ